MTFLQSTPIDPNTVINVNDSIKAVTSNLISQVKEDPNTLLQDLLQSAIDFGLKLLAAIAIYIVGAWLIKRVKIWMGKIFAKRKTEATLSTFINSLVSITLTVLLIIVTIGALGVMKCKSFYPISNTKRNWVFIFYKCAISTISRICALKFEVSILGVNLIILLVFI